MPCTANYSPHLFAQMIARKPVRQRFPLPFTFYPFQTFGCNFSLVRNLKRYAIAAWHNSCSLRRYNYCSTSNVTCCLIVSLSGYKTLRLAAHAASFTLRQPIDSSPTPARIQQCPVSNIQYPVSSYLNRPSRASLGNHAQSDQHAREFLIAIDDVSASKPRITTM